MRVVDALGLRRLVVVGHSMGAFLAPLVVQRLGGRAVAVVLLDGGVPPERSVLLRPAVVRTVFTVQLRRLLRTWPDVDRYTRVAEGGAADHRPDLHAGFRAWSEAVLEPRAGGFRPRLDARRVVADGVDSLTRPAHLPGLRQAAAPVHLIAAARGADDTPARVPLRRRHRRGPCGPARSHLGAGPGQPRHPAVRAGDGVRRHGPAQPVTSAQPGFGRPA